MISMDQCLYYESHSRLFPVLGPSSGPPMPHMICPRHNFVFSGPLHGAHLMELKVFWVRPTMDIMLVVYWQLIQSRAVHVLVRVEREMTPGRDEIVVKIPVEHVVMLLAGAIHWLSVERFEGRWTFGSPFWQGSQTLNVLALE